MLTALSSRATGEPGDAANGERMYRACVACHSLEPNRNMTGTTMMSTGMMVVMVIYHLIIVIFAVSTTSADGTKLPIRDVFATVAIGVKAETYTHSEFFAFWPLRNMQPLPPSLADGVSW
jgi:hypothetical protein